MNIFIEINRSGRSTFNGLACKAMLLGLWLLTAGSAWAGGSVTNCTESALHAALEGGGVVLLECDGSIPLTRTLFITEETVLDGTGHNAGLTSGATNLIGLFVVQPGAKLTLRNLTVSGGNFTGTEEQESLNGETAFGVGLFNLEGTVILEGCTFADHAVTGGPGAPATIASGKGGHGGNGYGAAIYNYAGHLLITNALFAGNRAAGGQGGLGGAGLNILNGSVGGDGGDGGSASGAAIYNTAGGFVGIFDSTFASNRVSGNSAGLGGAGAGVLGFPGRTGRSGVASGAAVFNESGTLRIVNSTFLGNIGAGGAGNPGISGTALLDATDGTSGGAAVGGGVANLNGLLSLTNCTVLENFLLGGDGGPGGTGRTSGFGGAGGSGGAGGDALGGGVYTAAGGTTLIVNCTFSTNQVLGGLGGAGATGGGVAARGRDGRLGEEQGTAIFNAGGIVRLRNSILNGNGTNANTGGTILDEGFNLSSDGSAQLSAEGSRNAIDPLLTSLVTASAKVQTLALATNSPALNAIWRTDGNGSPPFDQRNALRRHPRDIGAFELDGVFNGLTLRAQWLTNSVVLTWPSAGDFVLQMTGQLTSSNEWMTAPGQPIIADGLNSLSIQATNDSGFYRLIDPSR